MIYEGNYKLGDLFNSRREKGVEGLPTLSVTLDRGLVRRDSIARKTESNLRADEHLLVKEKDIAYNMMRMWQGASGMSVEEGVVSPAYIVLTPTNAIDSVFASYMFKTRRVIYLFWAYSYGLTSDRLRLYFNDFCKIPVFVPSIEEQTKITLMLLTWDKAIDTTKKLIKNSEAQKSVLIQKLLSSSEKLTESQSIKQPVRFKELLIGKRTKGRIVQTNKAGKGVPYVGASSFDQKFELFTTDAKALICEADDILILWDGEYSGNATTGITGAVSSTVARFQINNTKVSSKYLTYCLNRDNKKIRAVREGSGIPHVPRDFETWYKIELPSTKSQKKIVSILRNCDSLIGKYENQLQFLNMEKTSLMQQLLTGKKRVNIEYAISDGVNKN